ncbi:MAG: nucleoside triphosphate pyrophosphohydrolase [Bacteroidales bacterium]|nr:nucleoside triphosphate pyrophosphohydrolase [Bacteroidales bacterium]
MSELNDPRLIEFKRLLDIMDQLREGCPWDSKQTFESLRCLTIEETYELSEAINTKNYDDVKKELGDLLLHIVFYSKIGDEQGLFDITSVIKSICEKLIRRHPHIFGDVKVADAEDVKANWEKIKLTEGKRHSALGGVPATLPALIKAYRIQEKAQGLGFDWENKTQVWDKVLEEVREFQAEEAAGSDKMSDEFGDLLFALVNYARFTGIVPEDALEHTNKKFISRFKYMEEAAYAQGRSLADMNLEEMEVLWQQSKTVAGNE